MERACLIVIYNIKVSQSKTFESIKNIIEPEDKLIIYDNSPKSQLDVPLHENMVYYHDVKNEGLYMAYNFAVDYCRKKNIQWLTLFDQDTKVSDTFFKSLSKTIKGISSDVACIIPKVILENNKQISPYFIENNLFLCAKKTLTMCGINSGNTINIHSFSKKKNVYSIEFPLDFLDYDFFMKVSRDGLLVVQSQETILQDLSVKNYTLMSDFRFESFVKSESRFVRKYYPEYINNYRLKLFLRIFKLILQRANLVKIKLVFDTIWGRIK